MAFQPRWWVGYNTSQGLSSVQQTAKALAGGELFGGSPSGYESMPSGNATDDAIFAGAAAKNGGTTGSVASPVTVSVENVTWFNVHGPFATQAQANAAIPIIDKANPSQSIGSQAVDLAKGSPSTSPVTDPLDYLADVGDFFHRLTEASTWERVGEILAGVILLYVAVNAMTGDKISGAAKKTVKTAAMVAPK